MLNPSSFFSRIIQLTSFLFLYLSVSTASAQVYYSSSAAGAGGSGRAAVGAGDVVFLNPATLVFLKNHSFFASFAKNQMAFSLTDNTDDSAFPGALSYLQTKVDDYPVQVKNNDWMLTLAESMGDKWAFGLTGHYFQSTVGDEKYTQTNVDAGLIFVPTPNWGFGAVLYNALGARSNVPEVVRLTSKFGIGMNYLYKDLLRLRLDAVSGPDSNYGHSAVMGGLESILGTRWVIWRVGGGYDGFLQRTLATAGIGFEGPKFSLIYAYQGNTKDSGDYRHSVDLAIPF